jgi:hypothetical protein
MDRWKNKPLHGQYAKQVDSVTDKEHPSKWIKTTELTNEKEMHSVQDWCAELQMYEFQLKTPFNIYLINSVNGWFINNVVCIFLLKIYNKQSIHLQKHFKIK